jgi:AraC-like DNA-binding protein
MQMLRETDACVKQVAFELGYKSTSNFSNAFKKTVGICPFEFMNEGVESE